MTMVSFACFIAHESSEASAYAESSNFDDGYTKTTISPVYRELSWAANSLSFAKCTKWVQFVQFLRFQRVRIVC